MSDKLICPEIREILQKMREVGESGEKTNRGRNQKTI